MGPHTNPSIAAMTSSIQVVEAVPAVARPSPGLTKGWMKNWYKKSSIGFPTSEEGDRALSCPIWCAPTGRSPLALQRTKAIQRMVRFDCFVLFYVGQKPENGVNGHTAGRGSCCTGAEMGRER